ncbi:MAG TPA: hypothetical protein VJO32_09200 [Ktedonobacteraceae bacterium]|nr:hypothetical protein [Ktedonobacteraceae bacterium]
MITQAFKRWLRNMFAWWPWKHTPPAAYRRASGPLVVGTPQEGISLSAVEGTMPQASMTPRLSTIEERPERTISAPNDMAETPLPPSLRSSVDTSTEPGKENASHAVPSTPTPQQRLEFLQYLVKHGIVNEGREDM